MGRGTAWLHGSCLASPHQHRDRAKRRHPLLWALARSFLSGGQLHSRGCLGNSLSLWGRLSHHRGAATGRRAPSVLPRSPSPPRPCAARTAQTLVVPSGLWSPQAVPGPSLLWALHHHDGATCSPSPQPGGGAQPVPAPLCGTPRTPALTHVLGGCGSRLQLRAQGKDTHEQNAGGFHGAPRGRRRLARVSRGLYLRGVGEGLPHT